MEKDEKDQKENGAAPEEIDPNALLKNIEGMFQRFVGGAEAKAAATTQIEVKDNTPPIESKVIGTEEDKGETHADRTAKFVDPLRKSFERLAQIHPGYRRLGTNAAMDDPYGYLQRERRGRSPHDHRLPARRDGAVPAEGGQQGRRHAPGRVVHERARRQSASAQNGAGPDGRSPSAR